MIIAAFNVAKDKALESRSAGVTERKPIWESLKKGDEKKASKAADFYKDLFGDDFYMEIQDHSLEEEKEPVQKMVAMAKDKGVPLVATNDVHYLNSDDAEAHDLLVCIGEKRTVNETNRVKFGISDFCS